MIREPIAGRLFLSLARLFQHQKERGRKEASLAAFSPNLKRVLSETCVGNCCKLDFLFPLAHHIYTHSRGGRRPRHVTMAAGESDEALMCGRKRRGAASLSRSRQINLFAFVRRQHGGRCFSVEAILPLISVCGKCPRKMTLVGVAFN